MSNASMVAYLVRIEVGRRWQALLLLSLLVAVILATVLASLAGARRSATAFDRYIEAMRSPDAAAFGDPAARDTLADLQSVEAAVDFELVAAGPAADADGFYPLIVSENGVVPYERMRLPVVAGRFPERDAPLEVALSERTARRLDVGVGDVLPLVSFTPEAAAAIEESGGQGVSPDGPEVTLDVVGLVRDPGDVGGRESDLTLTFLTPAFRERYSGDAIGTIGDGTFISLAEGHDLADVSQATRDLDIEIDDSFSTDGAQQQFAPTMRAIATSLRIFAAVAAVAGLIAIGQAVARLQLGTSGDDETLGALGTSRAERWARLAVPGALAVAIGSVAGVVGALAASPLFPVGLARRAEPDPGWNVDTTVFWLGAVSVAALVLLVAVLARWRVRRSADAATVHVSRLGRAAADLGAPAPGVTGLSLAAGTPGRPGRIALVGTLLSVLGVLAALVFAASVDRLQEEPELYGWGWDATIEGADITDLGDSVNVGPALSADPDVLVAETLYSQVPITMDGTPSFAMAVAADHDELQPIVVSGDAPHGAGELALGRDTLDAIGADVGDSIAVSVGDDEVPMRISGVVALPVPEDGGSSATGAYLSAASVGPLEVDAACDDPDGSCTETIAIALRAGADAGAFAARHEDPDADIAVGLPAPPGEIDRLTAVEDLPQYLAVFLAALAAAAVSFATATTVRQRRRDLAVLRVLGMTGANLRLVVVVLVLALTAGGALLGGALGLIVGRQVWRAVSGSVSLPFSPSLPILAAFLVPVAAILFAQLIATASRRAAGRVPAALVLRAE